MCKKSRARSLSAGISLFPNVTADVAWGYVPLAGTREPGQASQVANPQKGGFTVESSGQSGRGASRHIPLLGLTGGGIVALALGAMGLFSAPGLAKLGGATLSGVGVLWGSRNHTHFRLHYRGWRPRPSLDWTAADSRRLSSLVLSDGGLALALFACGIWACLNPSSWLVLGIAVGAAAAILLSAGRMADLLESTKGGPPTGTDRARFCRIVRACRWTARKLGGIPCVKPIDEWLWSPAPPGQLSKLATVSIIVLATIAVAQAWAVAPAVIAEVNGEPVATLSGDVSVGVLPETASGSSPTPSGHQPQGSVVLEPADQGRSEGCDVRIAAKGGLSPKLASKLTRRWRMFGAPNAGCPGTPQPIPGSHGSFYVPGYCEGRFWSAGIVSPRSAVVVLDPLANFTRSLVRRGALIDASVREPIGGGDFHVLYTHEGGWVAIRQGKTDGNGGLDSPPKHCSEIEPALSRYVLVPPKLADLWLQFGEYQQATWPKPDSSRVSPNRTYFSFYSAVAEGTPATGFCATPPNRCQLRFGKNERWHSSEPGSKPVTASRVREHGPG